MQSLKTAISLIALSFSCFSALASSEAFIQDALQKRSEAFLIRGAVTGFIHGREETEVVFGDGKSDRDVFAIGSISKAFTGILIAQLSQEIDPRTAKPAIDLHAPISTYISELENTFAGTLTVLQLGLHEGRLPTKTSGHWSESELLNFLKSYQPDSAVFPVGARSYSNIGFAALGLLVRRVCGKSYTTLVQDRILDPLKMKDTGFLTSSARPSAFVPGYDVLLRSLPPETLSDLESASGGIYSDLKDMMVFLRANLAPDTSALGSAIQLSHELGIGWDSLPGALPLWKNGGMLSGYSSLIQFDPESKTGMVLLTNSLDIPVTMKLGAAIFKGEDAGFAEKAMDPGVISVLSGEYHTPMESNLSISIFETGKGFLGLRLSAGGRSLGEARLMSIGDNWFVVNNGVQAADFIKLKEDGGFTYFEDKNKLDSAGKPVYESAEFSKE